VGAAAAASCSHQPRSIPSSSCPPPLNPRLSPPPASCLLSAVCTSQPSTPSPHLPHSPRLPAPAGDEEAQAAPPAYSAADAACPLQCSSILAGAVRRLRCQQEVLQLDGELPEHGSAGTWEDSQPPGLLAHDGSSRSPLKAQQVQSAPKLSVAEQVRQKLAANPRAGGLGTKGGIAKAPRRPRQAVSGEVLRCVGGTGRQAIV
jgi:hypothetical protein